VHKADANPLTGNVLVVYEPGEVDQRTLLAALAGIQPEAAASATSEPEGQETARRSASPERGVRLCIDVPRPDRDARIAPAVAEAGDRRRDVTRAVANPPTGRVLAELSGPSADPRALRADIASIALPRAGPGDAPRRGPVSLGEAMARLVGSALRLGLVGLRAVFGRERTSIARAVLQHMAGAVRSFEPLAPLARHVHDVLEREPVRGVIGLVSVTRSDGLVGLAMAVAQVLASPPETPADREPSPRNRSGWAHAAHLPASARAGGRGRSASAGASRLTLAVRLALAVATYRLPALSLLCVAGEALVEVLGDLELASRS
jgi:hypothetical protein